jgi:TIR domain
MSAQKRYDIFLSHNSRDKLLVEILAEQLRESALEVWLDQDNLYGGDILPQEIQKAIANSKTALFCIGGYGLGKWQQSEMNLCKQLSIEGRLKIITIVLPPLEIMPEETEYLFLKPELYLKWKIGDSDNLQRLIYSVSQWLPVWREQELKRLTEQRDDTEKKLQEIEENIQQVEKEIGIEVDPYRQKAVAWISSVRNRVAQHVKKALKQFPKLDEKIKLQESGFEFLCIELDTCLEFIYFAFRKRDHIFLNDLCIEFSVLEFESEDGQENREIYLVCLNMIEALIPQKVLGESVASELAEYFDYLYIQVLSLI